MHRYINRFFEIANYDPRKGKITEGVVEQVDISDWVRIGEIPYYGETLYIFVDPRWKERDVPQWLLKGHVIRLTPNEDGSGTQMSYQDIPTFYSSRAVIYDEYKDSEYADMLIGSKRKPNEQLEKEHEELMSNLFIVDGKVCLHHNSSVRITDGVVKKGRTSSYSNNSDLGVYFWGSQNTGRDPSNDSLYTYYSLIPIEVIYDKYSNPQRLTVEQAFTQYNYVADFWHDHDAVLVRSCTETPIWRILDKRNGEWYDADWNKVEPPF